MTLNVNDVVPAAMAAGGVDAVFSPIQIQKLLFIIDREIPEHVNGPHFNFKPFDYGPFDKKVYMVLEKLEGRNYIVIGRSGRYPVYALTEYGMEAGTDVLMALPNPVLKFMVQVSSWVRNTSFRTLLRKIYLWYPDMVVNNVPQELASEPEHPTTASRALLRGAASVLTLVPNQRARAFPASPWGVLDEDWQRIGDDLRTVLEREGPRVIRA